MILFFADRLAAAHTDILTAYKVTRKEGATRGQLFLPPNRIVDFRIVTNCEHLRGYRNFAYVILPSAARNYDLPTMIDWARALGGWEESYPDTKNTA